MRLTVGRIVHYRDHGVGRCLAALVVLVEEDVARLRVFVPIRVFTPDATDGGDLTAVVPADSYDDVTGAARAGLPWHDPRECKENK